MNGLLEYGLLSTKEVDRRTVLRRLGKLTKLKWFIRHKVSYGREIIWTLELKGSQFLARELYLKGINRSTLYHDLTVSEMKISFKN